MANTWYPVATANALAGSDLALGDADITASFNSTFANWYLGTDGNAPGQYDLVTVVLHELGHGLGFFGSMRVASGLGSWGQSSGFPFVYDVFAINSESTYPVGNPNSLMTPAIGQGEAIHDPGPIVRGMFADVGWTLGSVCSYALSQTSFTVGAGITTGASVTVTTTPGCGWSAVSNSAFLTVTGGASGSGSGTVTFSVAGNIGTAPRVGTLTIAGQTVTVTQTGCTYALTPPAVSLAAGPASSSVTVTAAAPTCAWTAVSNAAFVTVTGGSAGTGNGIVSYDVLSNVITNTMTPARAGTITIGGQTFTVSQAGCSFSLAPTATTFDATGGSGAVGVTTGAACTWTVVGVPAWATTMSGSSGTGAGAWQYDVSANGTLSPRAGVVTVAGQPFGLTQLAVAVKPLVAGARMGVALADGTSERWASVETVAGRSYCASLTPGRSETARATPALGGFRADGSTVLTVGPGGDPALPSLCFIAPATETALFRATQSDSSLRSYLLAVTETTVWSNWFFIGGDYSSYTLLRNTTGGPVTAAITWRDAVGLVVGQETVVVPVGGVVFRDARVAVAPGTLAGSVEVAHNGRPSAIVGSQTTLSVTTGLSFDTLLATRRVW